MYVTITRLRKGVQQIAQILTPVEPQVQTTLIQNPNEIPHKVSQMIRLVNVTDWTFLAVHEDSSAGYYEFVITLFQQLVSGEIVIAQIHSHRRLSSLILGFAPIGDCSGNNLVYPCTLLEFPPKLDSTMAVLLRDFISLLPCEVWRMEAVKPVVKSKEGSV